MSDERVVAQVVQQAAASEPILAFLTTVLFSDSLPLVTDLLSLLTHVARVSSEHLPFLQSILGGSDASHQPLTRLLGHREPAIRAKTCSLLGNLLRHSHSLPQALQNQLESLLESLLACLADRDQDVRRAASFAVGNAACHPASPPRTLRGAVPGLTRLLLDPNSRTRRNAASALGNLCWCSTELGELLLESRAPHVLLEVACRDPQASVRERALLALRAASQHPGVQQVTARPSVGLLVALGGCYWADWWLLCLCVPCRCCCRWGLARSWWRTRRLVAAPGFLHGTARSSSASSRPRTAAEDAVAPAGPPQQGRDSRDTAPSSPNPERIPTDPKGTLCIPSPISGAQHSGLDGDTSCAPAGTVPRCFFWLFREKKRLEPLNPITTSPRAGPCPCCPPAVLPPLGGAAGRERRGACWEL